MKRCGEDKRAFHRKKNSPENGFSIPCDLVTKAHEQARLCSPGRSARRPNLHGVREGRRGDVRKIRRKGGHRCKEITVIKEMQRRLNIK